MHYHLYWITQIHELTMNYLSSTNEPMTYIFYATTNAPKSHTMKVKWVWLLKLILMQKRITSGRASLTLLCHVLLLRALFQQTPTSLKNRLSVIERIYSTTISSLNYLIKNNNTSSLCFLFQWYLGSSNYVTTLLLSHNSILDDTTKGTTSKLNGFLCCFRSNNYH